MKDEKLFNLNIMKLGKKNQQHHHERISFDDCDRENSDYPGEENSYE